MNQELQSHLLRVLDSRPSGSPDSVSGGCIHQCFHWGNYFIKTNTLEHEATFRTEATGLQLIAATETIRVPEVVTHGIDENSAYLVLEHLELTSSGNEALLGEKLAALHQHESEQFGFPEDNFIGATPQPNPWTDDWRSFFRDQRLGHMLTLLETNGIHFSHTESLLSRVSKLLPENPKKSLLHGDLWGGNKAFLRDGTPVIFDPACYHGHAACDLAMTTLFGGFSNRFYDAYRSSSNLDDPTLHEIYNLYHILNHALLFGGSYVSQADGIIRRFTG
ncbi:fructosamine kinase family protein [Haloferula sp.]|uniref:fructosamine kinase family protein n=1 Tax=Haloferula sp. TaxID=2497595 RepID=UPI00329E0471